LIAACAALIRVSAECFGAAPHHADNAGCGDESRKVSKYIKRVSREMLHRCIAAPRDARDRDESLETRVSLRALALP